MLISIIYLASDHAGSVLRAALATHLTDAGFKVCDLGPDTSEPVDYPDYAVKLAKALEGVADARGVAVCGSGIGISIALNRFCWVRAALVGSVEAATLSRQHNDANVLALGERMIDQALAIECLNAFLKTGFEGGRHQRRVDKLTSISRMK